jgi:hypothetical protein
VLTQGFRPGLLSLAPPGLGVADRLLLFASSASSAGPILVLGKTCQEGARGDFRGKLLVGLEI